MSKSVRMGKNAPLVKSTPAGQRKSTAKKSATTVARPLWQEKIALRLREGAMILLGTLCLAIAMALLSYSPRDAGWSHTALDHGVHNAAGPTGAWLADILFMAVGFFAYLFPLLLAVKTLQLFHARRQGWEWSGWLFSWRLCGLALLVLAGSSLAFIHFQPMAGMPASAGGVLGQSLGELAIQALNVQGSTLLFLALFLFGLTLFTDLSWFQIMDLIGETTLDLLARLRAGVSRLWDGRREHQQERARLRRLEELRLSGERAEESSRRMEDEPFQDQASLAALWPKTDSASSDLSGERCLAEEHSPVSQAPTEMAFDMHIEPMVEEVPVVEPVPFYEPEPDPEPEMPAAPTPAPRTAPVINQPQALPTQPSQRVMKEKQATLFVDGSSDAGLPPLSLLDPAEEKKATYSPESLENISRLLETKLKEFGVEVVVEAVHPGPVITRFEIQPAPGVKVSRIANLAKDLARSLAVFSVRVVEVIPGKTTVGIEIPNEDRQMVRLSEVLETSAFDDAKSPVTLALGQDIGGHPIVADLAKMPHLLVAGTTGSGKSVGVNAMLLSILFEATPEQARLIMIDPKMLELSIYEGIPHLLCPVVTDMKEAANALRWCVAEMERRYKLMAAMGVRNLAGFNRKVREAAEAGEPLGDPLYHRQDMDDEPPLLEPLPTIVVVVDEFADMMMIVGKKVEELIARIAQKARAAGIHLILATQRPSVDVITGLIKANIPTRIAFQVSSKIDSRTILDQGGAEQLLGHGDMLYLPPGTGMPIRVHGAFVSDDEVHRVVEAWKERGAPDYIEDILSGAEEGGSVAGFDGGDGGEGSEEDPLYDEAVRFVTETRRASISSVQRKLKIGYNRAARMIEAMEMAGVVTAMSGNGSREVVAPAPMRD